MNPQVWTVLGISIPIPKESIYKSILPLKENYSLPHLFVFFVIYISSIILRKIIIQLEAWCMNFSAIGTDRDSLAQSSSGLAAGGCGGVTVGTWTAVGGWLWVWTDH